MGRGTGGETTGKKERVGAKGGEMRREDMFGFSGCVTIGLLSCL